MFKIKIKTQTSTILQKNIMSLVFLAIIIPTFIFGGSFYYVIEHFQPNSNGYLEIVEAKLSVLKAIVFICISFPTFIILFWLYTLNVINKIIGPLEKINNDLDEIAKGNKPKKLELDKGSLLNTMVGKINQIIDK